MGWLIGGKDREINIFYLISGFLKIIFLISELLQLFLDDVQVVSAGALTVVTFRGTSYKSKKTQCIPVWFKPSFYIFRKSELLYAWWVEEGNSFISVSWEEYLDKEI